MINSEPSIAHKDYFSTEHLRAGLKTRALRGASLTVIGQIASFLIETIGTITLARLLSPHDFGLVTMVASLSLLLQSFVIRKTHTIYENFQSLHFHYQHPEIFKVKISCIGNHNITFIQSIGKV